MTRIPTKAQKTLKTPKSISDEEVARFLKHLASTYRDKRTGNPLLSEALVRVAGKILESEEKHQQSKQPLNLTFAEPELSFGDVSPRRLDELSADELTHIVQNTSVTKMQLVQIAAVRFGIPRSKLVGSSIDQVRNAIRSAIQHETSLAVITEQAARYGGSRQS